MWRERFLNVFHPDPSGPILALPEQPINKHLPKTEVSLQVQSTSSLFLLGTVTHLKKVSDVGISSFWVWSRHLKQGTFLANHKNIHNLPYVVTMSCSQNQEICLWHFVEIYWCPEKIVLKCLKRKYIRQEFTIKNNSFWISHQPAAVVQDVEIQGKEMCGSTQFLHTCSLVLLDPYLVSKETDNSVLLTKTFH